MDIVLSMINTFTETAKIFLDSNFFLVVKFFIAIYVTVLFVDLVLLLIVRGLGGNIRTAMRGTDMPTTPKKKIQKRWTEIEGRIRVGGNIQYKLAILEADRFVDEILSGIGYEGKNIIEKLEGVTDQQLSYAQPLREVHAIRNEIINSSEFSIDEDRAREAVKTYRELLENLEII
jgi:hypothetical protein